MKKKLSDREQGLLDEELLAAIVDGPRDDIAGDGQARIDRIAALLARGALPREARNKMGRDALILAAKHGSAKMVAMFLEAGANPMAKDIWGTSALAWAATRNIPECVELLIPVSIVDDEDCSRDDSPLMRSIKNNRGDEQSNRCLAALLEASSLSPELGYGPSFADDLERDGMQTHVISAIRREVSMRAAQAEAAQLSDALGPSQKWGADGRKRAL